MSADSARRTVFIPNPQGLHLRPADAFVRLATEFVAEIKLTKDNQTVDGKSILGIVTLAAEQGSQIHIEAIGSDAQKAADALARLVENGFIAQNDEKTE